MNGARRFTLGPLNPLPRPTVEVVMCQSVWPELHTVSVTVASEAVEHPVTLQVTGNRAPNTGLSMGLGQALVTGHRQPRRDAISADRAGPGDHGQPAATPRVVTRGPRGARSPGRGVPGGRCAPLVAGQLPGRAERTDPPCG